MAKRYVSVTFKKQSQHEVIAQVDSDLSGVDLESAVEVPHEWMQQFFGEEWHEWEVDDVTEITERWAILKERDTNASFQRELAEAPLFEVADDEGQ